MVTPKKLGWYEWAMLMAAVIPSILAVTLYYLAAHQHPLDGMYGTAGRHVGTHARSLADLCVGVILVVTTYRITLWRERKRKHVKHQPYIQRIPMRLLQQPGVDATMYWHVEDGILDANPTCNKCGIPMLTILDTGLHLKWQCRNHRDNVIEHDPLMGDNLYGDINKVLI